MPAPTRLAIAAVLAVACGGGAARRVQLAPVESPDDEQQIRQRIAERSSWLRSLHRGYGPPPLVWRRPPGPACRLDERPASCDACDLESQVCPLATDVCDLAAVLDGDAWASGKCEAARAACLDLSHLCCSCAGRAVAEPVRPQVL